MNRAVAPVLSLACVLSAFACKSERDQKPPPAAVVPQAECPVPAAACDITTSDCQLAVLNLTSCVREDDDAPLPAVRVITPDDFRAQLLDEVSALKNDPLFDSALVALHLLPAGMTTIDAAVDAQAEGVVAYYDDETKAVTIIDGGQPSDPQELMYELSHELVHYLQDRSVDLGKLKKAFPDTNDGQTAARSLIEGEAVVTSTRALVVSMQRSTAHLAWGSLFDNLDMNLLASVNEAPSPLATAALILPYAVGTRYIGDVWAGFDRGHVDELFDDAPRAVVDWFAGYGSDMPSATLVQALDCAPPEAPAGFVLETLDSFGPTGALALLAAAGGTENLSLPAALRGDAIAVYDAAGGGGTGALVAWRLRFKDAASAREFQTEISGLAFTTQVFGAELVLSTSSAGARNPLTGQVLEACPKLGALHPQMSAADSGSALLKRLPHRLGSRLHHH